MANKKQEKFSPVVAIFLCIVFLIIGLVVGFYTNSILNAPKSEKRPIVSGELSIHFLELGNNNTGDCTYIKAGDTDILIDAGSKRGSAETIDNYVKNYCTDGILEYVIATHAHEDHIAGFAGDSKIKGIFDRYECKTIIEFAKTNSSSNVYNDYCEKRNKEVSQGAVCYTALDCIQGVKGASKVINVTEDASITMEILYQKFYEVKASTENDYSVCLMINQGDNHYLFTGDLELEGEKSLVQNNKLPEVELFKGGHHGSVTSSNECLLSVIKPKCVCVCCCAGAVEYTQTKDSTFPSQAFINRVSEYTDNVYVTTLGKVQYDDTNKKYIDVGFESLNGNIIYSCKNGDIDITCSNINDKLKDTVWFKNNRKMPDSWK